MSEHDLQASFFNWIDHYIKTEPEVGLFFAIPNGGWFKNKNIAIKMKREGLRSGVLDTFLPIPKGGYHGLFLEFKWNKNTLTTSQKLFKKLVEHEGYKVGIAYNLNEAINITKSYLKPLSLESSLTS